MLRFKACRSVRASQAQGQRVRSRWIDENNLEGGAWIVRSRLCDTFAGTPSSKAMKLGLIPATTDLFGIKAYQNLFSFRGILTREDRQRGTNPRHPTSRRRVAWIVRDKDSIRANPTIRCEHTEG